MEKSTVLMSGAQAPKRESLGSRYPRKYISSTMGPATAFTANPTTHVVTNAAVEYREKSSSKRNESASQEKTFLPTRCRRRHP